VLNVLHHPRFSHRTIGAVWHARTTNEQGKLEQGFPAYEQPVCSYKSRCQATDVPAGLPVHQSGGIPVELQPAIVQKQKVDLEFEQEPETPRVIRPWQMVAMDVITQHHGKGTLHVGPTAQTAPQRTWGIKREKLTPSTCRA